MLDFSIRGNGTQRHRGEQGAEEGDGDYEESLPHPRTAHDVEKPQKNQYTCSQRRPHITLVAGSELFPACPNTKDFPLTNPKAKDTEKKNTNMHRMETKAKIPHE